MTEYYLNQSGSRWVVIPKPKIQVVFPDGHEEERTVLEYESFGNFASLQICVKGKKTRHLVKSDGKIHLAPLSSSEGKDDPEKEIDDAQAEQAGEEMSFTDGEMPL